MTVEQVAILAQQQRGVRPVQARLAILPAPDLGLKQRLGRQEVIVLTERLVPFEQLVLVHADHASLLVLGGLRAETAAG